MLCLAVVLMEEGIIFDGTVFDRGIEGKGVHRFSYRNTMIISWQ